MLTVHVLGRVEVRRNGTPLDLGGPQQRAVIAHLALDVGRIVSVDRLIDRLWGDEPPRTPLGTLQSFVSRLRRVIEPDRASGAAPSVLVSHAPGYVLQLPPERVDAHEFEQLVAAARDSAGSGDHATAVDLLDRALSLWVGPALAGLGQTDQMLAAAARLDEARNAAVDDRFDALLSMGRHGDLVGGLQAAVDEHPLRERRWAQLAVALYRSSRQADALRTLSTARTVLAEELGLDPGPELQRLERQILEHDPVLAPVPAPVLAGTVAAPPVDRQTVDLVGRTGEWATLVDALDQTDRSGARLALVTGEPGIGKSTVCSALLDEAASRGWATATGRCVEAGLAPSLWPLIEIVRAMLAASTPPPEARRRSALHQIAAMSEPLPRAFAPVELADQFVQLVDDLDVPRWVLWLDDAHWADQPTLDVVRLALGRLDNRRVLVVVTHRPPEIVPDSLLGEALGSLTTVAPVDRVTLSALPLDDVAALLELTTGSTPADDVVRRVHDRAGGNPLFVTELGRLVGEGPFDDVEAVPEAIRDVVRRRLAPLPAGTLAEIELAAVVGERFDLPTVIAASERDADACLDALDAAIVTRVILPDADEWRFAHALVRDAVLAEIAPLRRARLHHRVAEALTAARGSGPDAAEPIAHHRLASLAVADRLVVAQASVRAADVARWRGAFDTSESYAEQALAILGGMPPSAPVSDAQLDALQALAGVSYLRGGQQSKGVIEARVAALAGRIGSDAVKALALFLNWGDIDEAEHLDEVFDRTEQARALAEQTDDPYAIVLTNYMLGSAALLQGQLATAVEHLSTALTASNVGTDQQRVPLPGVPTVSAIAYALFGDRERALELVDRQAPIWLAERSRVDPTAPLVIAFNASVIRAVLDDPPGVVAARHGVRPDPHDDSIEALTLLVLDGWARCRTGDVTGLDDARAAMDRYDAGPNHVLESWLRTCVGAAYLHLDDDRAVATLERAVDEARSRGEVWWLAETLRLSAAADRSFGNGAGATDMLAEARSIAASQGSVLLLDRIDLDAT